MDKPEVGTKNLQFLAPTAMEGLQPHTRSILLPASFSRPPRVLTGISGITALGFMGAQARLAVSAHSSGEDSRIRMDFATWHVANHITGGRADHVCYLTEQVGELQLERLRRSAANLRSLAADLRVDWLYQFQYLTTLSSGGTPHMGSSVPLAAIGALAAAFVSLASGGTAVAIAFAAGMGAAVANDVLGTLAKTFDASMYTSLADLVLLADTYFADLDRELARIESDPRFHYDREMTSGPYAGRAWGDLATIGVPAPSGAEAALYSMLHDELREAQRRALWRAALPAIYFVSHGSATRPVTMNEQALAVAVQGYVRRYPYVFVYRDPRDPNVLRHSWLTSVDQGGMGGDTNPPAKLCEQLFGDDGWPADVSVNPGAMSTRHEVFTRWGFESKFTLFWSDPFWHLPF